MSKTLGRTIFVGDIVIDGIISPPSFAVAQNDYAPTGINSANVIRLAATLASNITGILAPSPVRSKLITLVNTSAVTLTLVNNSASSLAANRFQIGANVAITTGKSQQLWYDVTTAAWRVF